MTLRRIARRTRAAMTRLQASMARDDHPARPRGWSALLLACGGLLAAASTAALPDAAATLQVQVQAARSDGWASAAPAAGWVDVNLPDDWGRRWPGFDGVVWYRLRWQQAEPLADTALFIEYLNMAGSVAVNGVLLQRDASLVEPLSRSWNTPRYVLLAPPLLRAGENEALLRVSGHAADRAGLGPVQVGDAATLRVAYERAYWLRQRINVVGLAIVSTLGLFFITLWLMRRAEVAYGWYGAQQLAWFVCGWNIVAGSPWPFASTDAYAALVTCALMLYCACYAMFVLRFFDRRWPRRERLLWCLTALACLAALVASHAQRGPVRDLLVALASLEVLAINLTFLWLAWRGGRTDQRVLSLCALVAALAGIHDALLIMRVIGGNTYYATVTAHLTVIGVAVALGWNFVRSLRRIEGFNAELQRNVDEARTELASTLQRQHELELVHARLGERVSLAHDLHDGLGGMLIGNIAALEQAPESVPSREVLAKFRELRDDLRLIIDTAAAQHYGEHSLAELLAPLRHRMTRLFEAHEVEVQWRTGGLEQIYLTTTQSLDLLRIVQEALANVLKHSGAGRVEVALHGDTAGLRLEVRDDGRGLPPDLAPGTGLRSMQARARRLGAALWLGAEGDATVVRLRRPGPAADEPVRPLPGDAASDAAPA